MDVWFIIDRKELDDHKKLLGKPEVSDDDIVNLALTLLRKTATKKGDGCLVGVFDKKNDHFYEFGFVNKSGEVLL